MPGFTALRRSKLYQRLLALYPAEFRDEYGDEMRQDFEARQRQEPAVRLWWETARDIFTTAPREHVIMLSQDLRFALRQLAAQPTFTAAAVLSLALGIGANSALFSVADGLLLRPAPVPEPEELVRVQGARPGEEMPKQISHPDYLEIREQVKSFRGVLAWSEELFGFAANAQDTPQLRLGAWVSGNFLRVAGLQPFLGRDFRPEEDQVPGRDPVVLLSYDAWVNSFASSPDVLGRKIRLNGQELTIIGVTPESFPGLRSFMRPAFFVPLAMSNALLANAEARFWKRREVAPLLLYARLAPGVTLGQAHAETAALGRRLAEAWPQTNAQRALAVRTEFEWRVAQSPPDVFIVRLLLTTSGLVLLIACANVANLLLARARSRQREVGIRLAIGAPRSRLFRQLMTESLVLAAVGGGAGLGVAWLGIQFFKAIPSPNDVPLVMDFALDRRALWFSAVASAFSALVFGVGPALRSLNPDLVTSLKAGEADAKTGGRTRWFGRNALVAGQLALSCILLVAGAMMVAGLRTNLLGTPGFRRDHLLLAGFTPGIVGHDRESAQRLLDNLLKQARELPAVRSAALTTALPTTSDRFDALAAIPEGYTLPRGQKAVSTYLTTVSDQYFETLGIPLRRGRGFTAQDKAESTRVAVVNDVFAERYWPGQEALGKRITALSTGAVYQVVGVAQSAKYVYISEAPTPAVYLPVAQSNEASLRLVLHTTTAPENLIPPLRQLVSRLEPNLPIQGLRTMEDYYARRTLAPVNVLLTTVMALGALGLVLAVIGLYGVMSYSVSRRTRELGVRLAVGADRARIVRLVLEQGGRLALVGIGIGLVLSLLGARALEAGFVGLAVAHPAVFFAVPLLLLLVSLGACAWPAVRASRIEPVRALRTE